eukprot:TRINITY_DN7258_c0_g1_i1.p1 TRINITY_DN7258_c0_g1~~TRINITY_DN7258_c0_g1_i1.p1  ORF type:complete len:529 (-),score=60.33 TRINITY_DN7258_c0_g1_i1:723-2309(-)
MDRPRLLPLTSVVPSNSFEDMPCDMPVSECQSPMARWLEQPREQSRQLAPNHVTNDHRPAANMTVLVDQQQAPLSGPACMQNACRTPQLVQQLPQVACIPVAPVQQPACVVVVPVAGPPPVPIAGVLPQHMPGTMPAAAVGTCPAQMPRVCSVPICATSSVPGSAVHAVPHVAAAQDPSAAVVNPTAPLFPRQNVIGSMSPSDQPSCSRSETCSTHVSHETPATSSAESSVAYDSEDMRPTTTGTEAQKLSASAVRRRRRQKAAQAQGRRFQPDTATSQGFPSAGRSCSVASKFSIVEICTLAREKFERGDQVSASLSLLRGSVRKLAFDGKGCRVLQLAIEKGSRSQVAALIMELRGSVRRAVASPHANFVIQKIIEIMPAAHSDFIVDELSGSVVKTARNKFGCRILCRLLEHSGEEAHTMRLMQEVFPEIVELARHDFGHHVIESILEHGADIHKSMIVQCLERDVAEHVQSKNSLFVYERAVKNCTDHERSHLVAALKSYPGTGTVMMDPILGMHLQRIFALKR